MLAFDKGRPARPAKPREPLYHLEEIASRLKVSRGYLVGQLGGAHRGDNAPRPSPFSLPGRKKLYLLSEFKTYLKSRGTPQ